MDTDVPVFVRGAISDLKRALALQTDAVFARLPGDTTAALAKQRLSATMPSSMVGKISDDQWRKLGEDNSKRIEPIELRTQRPQNLVRQLANLTQRMLPRNTLLQRHIAEHPVLNPLVSTHTPKTKNDNREPNQTGFIV